ncbi:hypothetical protein KO481_04770 [Nocardia sp. NEAU-G5]|uniref:Uncharacterized protein n=1 Tax=Nocardia albiluteola TaxID=2842303 RepID=A0ABS6AUX0_9NOCA|nr:hypothetical protein [Nocardia albiluteola]MBU3060838.1 hypothetical protein [Nocardia albiluteola]
MPIKRFAVYSLLAAAAVVTLGTSTATAGIPLRSVPPVNAPAPTDDSPHARPSAPRLIVGSNPVCLPDSGSSDPCLFSDLLSGLSSTL